MTPRDHREARRWWGLHIPRLGYTARVPLLGETGREPAEPRKLSAEDMERLAQTGELRALRADGSAR